MPRRWRRSRCITKSLLDWRHELFLFCIVIRSKVSRVAIVSKIVEAFDVGDSFFVSESALTALFLAGEEEAGFYGGAGEARGEVKIIVFEVCRVEVGARRRIFFGELAVDFLAAAA